MIDIKVHDLKAFMGLDSFKARGIQKIEAYIDSMVDITPGTLGGDLYKLRMEEMKQNKTEPITTRKFDEFVEHVNSGMLKLTRELGNLCEIKAHVTEIKTEMGNMARDIRGKPSNTVIDSLFDRLSNFATTINFNSL
jgi:hypothetical protein